MTIRRRIVAHIRQRLSAETVDRLRLLAQRIKSPLVYFQAMRGRHRNVGPRTFVDPTVQCLGWNNIRISENCVISEHTLLNVNNRNDAKTQISIAANSFVGRRNTISSGEGVFIGEYFLSGPDCKIIGSDHKIANPFIPFISSGNTVNAIIRIGANCWFGAGVTVLGNVTVGHGCVIGAGAVVLRDIPPFSLVVGSPGRIVKRFDMETDRWIGCNELTLEKNALLPSEERYLAILRAARPSVRMPRVAAGHAAGDLP